jgi:probable rRNA maturation factor
MIELTLSGRFAGKKLPESFFLETIEKVLKFLGAKGNFGLSINLVSCQEIRKLNKKYRQQDKSTDVLSFPLIEKKQIFSNRRGSAIIELGDIFICPDWNGKKASREDISERVAHGLLHLLGADHEKSPLDKKIFDKIHRATKQKFKTIKNWQDQI